MARTAVAALAALALVACAAAGAHVCKSPGCKQCDFVMKSEKKGQQEVCTLCDEAAGYFLKKKGVCGCAAGYFSRTSDGQRLDHCVQATGNVVAAAGALGDGLNAARECLDNSAPDASHAHCECKPGYYVLLGGVTPRCVQCGPGTFTDVPNVRAACKFCPIGKVATAARTGCISVSEVLGGGGHSESGPAPHAAPTTDSLSVALKPLAARAQGALSGLAAKAQSGLAAAADGLQPHIAELSNKAQEVVDGLAHTNPNKTAAPAAAAAPAAPAVLRTSALNTTAASGSASVSVAPAAAPNATDRAATNAALKAMFKVKSVPAGSLGGISSKGEMDARFMGMMDEEPDAETVEEGEDAEEEESASPRAQSEALGGLVEKLNLTAPLERVKASLEKQGVEVGTVSDYLGEVPKLPQLLNILRGGLPPIEDMPGFEHGSKNAFDTMYKLMRGAAGDTRLTDELSDIFPDVMNGLRSPLLMEAQRRLGLDGKDGDEEAGSSSRVPKPKGRVTETYYDY